MFRGILALTATCLVFAYAAPARAHIRWMDPTPRNDDSGLQTGPCGEVAATGSPTEYEVGSTITVEWDVVQIHGTTIRVAFSPAGDEGFDGNILVDDIPDQPDTPQTVEITLPSEPCEGCTLQLNQGDGNSGYFSCADITLVPVGSGGGTTSTTGAETDAATGEEAADESGGGCAIGGRPGLGARLGVCFGMFGLVGLRRRRP